MYFCVCLQVDLVCMETWNISDCITNKESKKKICKMFIFFLHATLHLLTCIKKCWKACNDVFWCIYTTFLFYFLGFECARPVDWYRIIRRQEWQEEIYCIRCAPWSAKFIGFFNTIHACTTSYTGHLKGCENAKFEYECHIILVLHKVLDI